MSDHKVIQETTSCYFNDILKCNVTPITVDDLPEEALAAFHVAIDEAFGDEAETVKSRVRYLIPYILQAIDWDIYGKPLEGWQLRYYYQRDRFIRKTGLRYEDFLKHEYLMNAIEDLGLDPEPVYEFILFLKYYFDLRSELRHSPLEQLQNIRHNLREYHSPVTMDISIGGTHYKIQNSDFIRDLFESIDERHLERHVYTDVFEEGSSRDKVRALDYYLVKTLLDYLPVKIEKRRGKYSQAERNFGLSVLHFVGRLSGDEPEFLCDYNNNATFDKLMRDFKDQPIPFAMELFL